MSNIFGINPITEQIKKNKNEIIIVHVYKDNKKFINFSLLFKIIKDFINILLQLNHK